MNAERLIPHMDWLFHQALRLCRATEDARELTQETLLSALQTPVEPADMQAFLRVILRRRHADMLRRKYRLPTVCIDCVPEAADESAALDALADHAGDAARVRREVAYLAGTYREAVIRHYLKGEKVADVADALGIPTGTVLSRLSAGRERMRKGLTNMEEYGLHSYEPQRLEISCHGRTGLHGEPFSLVKDDLLKQNILLTAYEKPLTPVEIARHMGIPTAYIEPAVDALVQSELMRVCTRGGPGGRRVVTDFVITGPEERTRTLREELALAHAHYGDLLPHLVALAKALQASPICQRQHQEAQDKLTVFFLLHLLSTALYTALQRIAPGEDAFPPRPDGGAWVAVGSRYPLDFDFFAYEPSRYCYGGMRWARWENYLGAKSIALHVYDVQPDLNRYQHGPFEMDDTHVLRLLQHIHTGLDPRETGFDPMLLQNIPHLADCGVLRMVESKPVIAVPVLSPDEYEALDILRLRQLPALADTLEKLLRPALPRLTARLPCHLEGRVAPCRRISCFALPMALREEAIRRGDWAEGAPSPAMVLVVEE